MACDTCQGNGGNCVQKDDMAEILDKIIAADMIVMATPVQMDLEALLDLGAQRFPIPQRAGPAQVARSLAQDSVHLPQLPLGQTPGTPRALSLPQPSETLASKRRTQFSTVRGAARASG